jgi:hypothetical protein
MTARTEITARKVARELLALGDAPPAPVVAPAPKPTAIDYPRLQGQMRWFEGLLKLYRATASAVSEQVMIADEDATPADDELVPVLRRAHRALLEHPVAAKRVYTAILAQGREFARTEEGAAMRERLAASAKVRRGALLWRSLAMGMLDDEDHGELPTTYLDNLLRAVDRVDLEELLGKLQRR